MANPLLEAGHISPMGPGFFIFFRKESKSGGGISRAIPQVDKRKLFLIKEDNEILEFIKMIVASRIL